MHGIPVNEYIQSKSLLMAFVIYRMLSRNGSESTITFLFSFCQPLLSCLRSSNSPDNTAANLSSFFFFSFCLIV